MKSRSVKIKRKYLFSMDILIASGLFLSTGLFRIDDVLLLAFILSGPYFVITRRKTAIYYLIIAMALSFVWMNLSKEYYENSSYYLHAIGINLYPLLAWTLGLTGVHLIYLHYRDALKLKDFWQKLSLYLVIYWPLLILVETVGYHFLNIKNAITVDYSGLPICDCIHAPFWMQMAYFAMGPVFFVISYIMHRFKSEIRLMVQKLMSLEEKAV